MNKPPIDLKTARRIAVEEALRKSDKPIKLHLPPRKIIKPVAVKR